MKKILVSAYGCEPLKGSESGVGWNWVLQMAKNNKLFVITRANNRDSIEVYLPEEVKRNIEFYFYDAPQFIKQLKNKAKGLYFYYFCWQIGIISLVKKILKENNVDYAMHLTFGSMWMPTFLPFFKVPFIWGPIGGGDCEPKSFLKVLPFKQRIMQNARYLMNALSIINPVIMIPALKATTILARTPNSAKVFPKFLQKKVKVILETAMEKEIFEHKRKDRPRDKTFRMITTGRLLPNKNILTAVRALKYVPKELDLCLTIVGNGYQRKQIEEETKRYGITDKIWIVHEIPRAEVLNMLEQSDIFLFPSLREGGSWSLMESMAIGLPVICLNWAGMAISTDDNCAIRLPVTNPEQMPKDMAAAIVKLVENPQLRKQMGDAGRKRIKEVFNWEAKGQFMDNLFAELESKQ